MSISTKRWLKVFSGFAVLLFLGITLAWSIFVVPIEATFNWSRSETSIAFTINVLFFSVGSLITGVLCKKLNFSNILKIVAIMIFGGFFLTSFVTNIYFLYATYGVIVGTGVGMGYNCIISACPLWLPEKSATATGILLMGYALSTALFGPILNGLIASIGIMNAFKFIAFVCGGGIFIFSWFISIPSVKEMKELPQVDRNKGKKDHNVITSEMIKKPIFWVYYVITILVPGVGLVLINHNSPILIEGLHTTAAFAAMIVSLASIGNGVGRFIFGFVFDKLGVKKSLIIVCGLFTIATLGVYLGFKAQSVVLYVASACLLLFSFGCNATTIPAIVRELFGHRTFSLNYSVVNTDALFTCFMPTIMGSIQVATGSYEFPLFIMLILAVINLLVLAVFIKLFNTSK